MHVTIDGETFEVVITRKRGNRNTYIRVKNDMKIYVTTNTLVPVREIEKLIYNNTDFITKMIDKMEKKNNKDDKFYYLGSEYLTVRTSTKGKLLSSIVILVFEIKHFPKISGL